MNNTVEIITLSDGTRIAKITSIQFKGKRGVAWKEVESYLRKYIGKSCEIQETHEVVHIGKDFPDEYAHSVYTIKLRGTSEKAKANAAQAILEMITIATNKETEDNKKEKHQKDAQKGWDRYVSRFALPVFADNGLVERYNCFTAQLLVRHAADGNLYLYDIMRIKKETDNLFQSHDHTQ
ncbi:MAG: hypothetical protein J5649_07895 [Lachnospiraceae bacterium]|nr:hypothetical protein [Lachnospiraceae bacterium]